MREREKCNRLGELSSFVFFLTVYIDFSAVMEGTLRLRP